MMPRFSFEVNGLKRISNDLRTWAAQQQTVFAKAYYEGMQKIRALLKSKRYPPQPTPKKGRMRYRRTGRLGSSWAVEGTGTLRSIVNRARQKGRDYSGYVVGDEQGRQASHMTHWWVGKVVMEREGLPTLRSHILMAMQTHARKLG